MTSGGSRDAVERGKRILASQLDMTARLDALAVRRRPDHIELRATPEHRDPVTGRHQLQPPHDLLAVGRYFRQARRRAWMSQDRLAHETQVSQSMISRFERGLAPGMRVEKLVALARALDRLFPFGTCPHEHECAWQPIVRPKREASAIERLIERILDPETDAQESPGDRDFEDEREMSFIDISVADLQSPTPIDQSDR